MPQPRKVEARTQFPSPFATGRTASATAVPAVAPATVPAATEESVQKEEPVAAARTNGPVAQVVGISQENVAEIKAAIQAQQKFLGEIVEQSKDRKSTRLNSSHTVISYAVF